MSQPLPLSYGFAGTSKYGQYYRYSGQINVVGVFAALLLGVPAGVLMGAVYSAAVIYIPYIKLRLCFTILFGMGLGAFPAWLMKKMKVRNIPVSLAVVGVVTLISYYFSWASWEAMVLREVSNFAPLVKLLTHPLAVLRVAQVIDETGTWTMGGIDAMKGLPLLIIWSTEALTVFGGSVLTVKKMLHQPFCEKCGQWCVGPKVVRRTAATDEALLKTKLEAGDFSYAAGLPQPTSGKFLEFQQHRCVKCAQLNTLSVVSRTIVKDRKGRVRKNRKTTVVDKLLISIDDVLKLNPASPVVAAAAPAAAKPVAAAAARKPLQSPQMLK
jgi:hypothetical protein